MISIITHSPPHKPAVQVAEHRCHVILIAALFRRDRHNGFTGSLDMRYRFRPFGELSKWLPGDGA